MTPKKLINEIIYKKNSVSILMIVVYTLVTIISYVVHDQFGEKSLFWYFGISALLIVIFVIIIAKQDSKIEKTLEDKITEENYELATILVEEKVINPSMVKPLLEQIANVNEE